MKSSDFVPTAWCSICNTCTLQICISNECGESYVYSAFYNEEGVRQSAVTRALVKFNGRGHAYFTKSRQRYYLSEFLRKDLCSNKG